MENENPLLGVVVPTYNHGHFLRSTILSLLNQTYPRVQIVIVDDCSMDNTKEILDEFSLDPRVSVLRNSSNLGESQSVNIGWAYLRTQYIAIVNSDDPQNPNWAHDMMNFIKIHPDFAAYYPNLQIIDMDGNVIKNVRLAKWNNKMSTERLLCVASAGTIFNRVSLPHEFVPRYNFVRYPSDLVQILNVSRYGDFIRVDNVHGVWRKSSDGLTATLGSVRKAEELHGCISYWLKQNLDSIENLGRLYANLYSQMWKLYRKELPFFDSLSRLLKLSGLKFFLMPINQFNICRAILEHYNSKR